MKESMHQTIQHAGSTWLALALEILATASVYVGLEIFGVPQTPAVFITFGAGLLFVLLGVLMTYNRLFRHKVGEVLANGFLSILKKRRTYLTVLELSRGEVRLVIIDRTGLVLPNPGLKAVVVDTISIYLRRRHEKELPREVRLDIDSKGSRISVFGASGYREGGDLHGLDDYIGWYREGREESKEERFPQRVREAFTHDLSSIFWLSNTFWNSEEHPDENSR